MEEKKPLKFETCGFNQGNWCKNPGRCEFKTRVYEKKEFGGYKKTKSFMCSEGYAANGC